MKREWFNSMRFNLNRGLEYRCAKDSLGPLENHGENEDPSIFRGIDDNILSSNLGNENLQNKMLEQICEIQIQIEFLNTNLNMIKDALMEKNSKFNLLDPYIIKKIEKIEVQIEFLTSRLKRMTDSYEKYILDSWMMMYDNENEGDFFYIEEDDVDFYTEADENETEADENEGD